MDGKHGYRGKKRAGLSPTLSIWGLPSDYSLPRTNRLGGHSRHCKQSMYVRTPYIHEIPKSLLMGSIFSHLQRL